MGSKNGCSQKRWRSFATRESGVIMRAMSQRRRQIYEDRLRQACARASAHARVASGCAHSNSAYDAASRYFKCGKAASATTSGVLGNGGGPPLPPQFLQNKTNNSVAHSVMAAGEPAIHPERVRAPGPPSRFFRGSKGNFAAATPREGEGSAEFEKQPSEDYRGGAMGYETPRGWHGEQFPSPQLSPCCRRRGSCLQERRLYEPGGN
jgi:hypothetical protein